MKLQPLINVVILFVIVVNAISIFEVNHRLRKVERDVQDLTHAIRITAHYNMTTNFFYCDQCKRVYMPQEMICRHIADAH